MEAAPNAALIDDLIKRRIDELLPQKLEEALARREETRTPSMSIIATKGTLDWAYPPFILATTAAAMGLEVTMFFTFYGLTLLKKKLDLNVVSEMVEGHMLADVVAVIGTQDIVFGEVDR